MAVDGLFPSLRVGRWGRGSTGRSRTPMEMIDGPVPNPDGDDRRTGPNGEDRRSSVSGWTVGRIGGPKGGRWGRSGWTRDSLCVVCMGCACAHGIHADAHETCVSVCAGFVPYTDSVRLRLTRTGDYDLTNISLSRRDLVRL